MELTIYLEIDDDGGRWVLRFRGRVQRSYRVGWFTSSDSFPIQAWRIRTGEMQAETLAIDPLRVDFGGVSLC